jgi:predicted NBD/HSP70 family sugar kinase
MLVNPSGATCRCGAQGCWETEIGRDAIVRGAGMAPERDEVQDVIEAAAAGSSSARAAIDAAGEWLGVGLANLVNLFNPEVIVLGGHLRLLFPLVSGTVHRRIHFALSAARDQVRVEVPGLDDESTLIGAAETAFASLLADPIVVLSRAPHAAAS